MFEWISANNPISFPKLGFEIDPPLGFQIGSVEVRFYGLIIAIGMVLAVIYGLRRRKQFGLKEDDILDGVLWIVPFAILCARAYYCLFSWNEFKDNPISVLHIWEGGLAIYGAVLGAGLCIILFSKIKKVSLAAVLDLVALCFLIGQSIGRWGNFFNREAHGSVTASLLGMHMYSDSTGTVDTYHPTFLYESLWNAAGFVLLHFMSKKRKYDGQIALGYVAWYGLGRTFVEGLRTDSLYFLREILGDKIRFSQVLAALSCVIAVVILVWKHFSPPQKALFVNGQCLEEPAKEAEDEDEEEEEEDEDDAPNADFDDEDEGEEEDDDE